MAHTKPGIVLKNIMPRQRFIRLPSQNGAFIQQQQANSLQQVRQCGNSHLIQQQQQAHHHHQSQNSGNYQYVQYPTINAPVPVRQPVQQHSFQEPQHSFQEPHRPFQEPQRNFINSQPSHSVNQINHQLPSFSPSFSPSHHSSMPSPYSNGGSAMSPYYEDIVQPSGRCSIPLGSNDRPVSVDMLTSFQNQTSPYVSTDARIDSNYGHNQPSKTPEYYSNVVSPSPLYHYDQHDAGPAFSSNNQLTSVNYIKIIAHALMRSAETFDPNPINIPNFFSTSRASIDSMDSIPDLEPVTDSYTLTDLIEIIERDIQETYMQQNVPILPVKTQKVKEIVTNETTLHKLLKPSNKNVKTMDFSVPPRANKKAIKRYQCIVCKKQFAGASHLRSHFKTAVHKNEVLNTQVPDPANMPETWKFEDWSCGMCKQTFVEEIALQKHISANHCDFQQ